MTTIRASLLTYSPSSNTKNSIFFFSFSLGWWTYFFVRLVLPILSVVLSFFSSLSCLCCTHVVVVSFLYSVKRVCQTHIRTYIHTYIYKLSIFFSLIRHGSFLDCSRSSFCKMLFLLVTSHFPCHDCQ